MSASISVDLKGRRSSTRELRSSTATRSRLLPGRMLWFLGSSASSEVLCFRLSCPRNCSLDGDSVMVIVAVSPLTSLSLRTSVKSSASRPCRFTPEERTLGIVGCVDQRADLKAMEEPKPFPYQESKACRPVRNPSPYRLSPLCLLLFSFPFIFFTSFSLFLPHLSIFLFSLTYISFLSSSSSPHSVPLTTSFFSHLPIHYLPMSISFLHSSY